MLQHDIMKRGCYKVDTRLRQENQNAKQPQSFFLFPVDIIYIVMSLSPPGREVPPPPHVAARHQEAGVPHGGHAV